MRHDCLFAILYWPRCLTGDRCGNVASILELDEHLAQEYKVFQHAPLVSLLTNSPLISSYYLCQISISIRMSVPYPQNVHRPITFCSSNSRTHANRKSPLLCMSSIFRSPDSPIAGQNGKRQTARCNHYRPQRCHSCFLPVANDVLYYM